MRAASRLTPTMAAIIKATAANTCQAVASPDAMRAGIKIGAKGGSSDRVTASGFVGFETTQK